MSVSPLRVSPVFDILRLKEGTSDVHWQIEGRVPVFRADFDLAAYIRLIERFYGFWAPLETRLARVQQLDAVDLDLAGRMKSNLLAKDLRALGRDPALVPQCRKLPAVDTFPQALGCLYVLEGSTLGAQYISRRLECHLQLTEASGAAFFNAYGDLTAERWLAFKRFVQTRVDRNDEEEAVDAARDAFECFFHWLG